MAMTTNCLTKLKSAIKDPDVTAKLEEALATGDDKLWGSTLLEAVEDKKLTRLDAILDANKRAGIIEYVKAQEALGVKPQEAMLNILSGSGTTQRSGIVSLDSKIATIRNEYIARNVELIHATRPTMMGLRRASNPEFVRNVVKGIFKDTDANVSKDIQAIADAWHQTTKSILNRFNRAGGRITELKGFNIPVNHYSPKMLKAGRDKWVEDASKLFNIRKNAEFKDGASDKEILGRIYDNITTEGADFSDFGRLIGKRGRKLGNSHQEFRVLQPENGDAWLKYNELYGAHNNPVDAMKEYIDSMATEIGLIETLGTSPTHMVETIVGELRRVSGKSRTGAMSLAALDQIRARLPRTEDRITNIFRGLRNFQTITKLPLSGITATSDAAFMATRSMYLGMKPSKVLARQIKNLATSKDYKTAARMGLVADYANHMAVSTNRYAESMGFSTLDRITDFSMRANGLNHWTNSAKASFGLEFSSFMAENTAKSFDDIPKGLRSAFQRYGIDSNDWAQFRKSTTKIDGVDFLDPMADTMDAGARAKLLGMIKEETVFAVPEPNAKSRAYASGTAPQNTVLSEVIKTGTQFKTFGISVYNSTMGIMLDKGIPGATKAQYAANLMLTTTLMGVAVIQLRDIAKGRTPREFSPKLVAEGMVQGGFLGIAGDIMSTDPTIFGGLPAKIVGPTVSDAQRVWKVMHGTMEEVNKVGGDWKKKLLPAIEQAGEELAFPLKLAPFRVAAERLMLDHARRLSDPDYYSKIRRSEKFLNDERGQSYWSMPK